MPRETCALLQDLDADTRVTVTRLMPAVYTELRRLAAHYLRGEAAEQTLQATALVHEAYLRLLGNKELSLQDRAHFVAVAAISMRRILVDRARRRLSDKRGRGVKIELLDNTAVFTPEKSSQLLALDDALDRLAALSPRQARVVELRFFAGLNIDEIAAMEGLSARTIKSDWSIARAWLHREIARAA
jgi:RNA polymerase sigma factor (TIGR02999 family)